MSGYERQVLIDGLYCIYRMARPFEEFRTSDGRPSGRLYGFIRTLTTVAKKWPTARLVVAWDTPGNWRKELYPEYKANRTGNRTELDNRQIYAASAFCKWVGIDQGLCTGQEADDVIGSLIDRSLQNIVFSRDRDFCQLVEDGVVAVYSPPTWQSDEKIFDEQKVVEEFGVAPRKLLLFRSLRGDSSDNLPGVRRFPTKKLLELVEKHDRVEDLLENPDPTVRLTDYQKKALQEFRDQGPVNYRLMRIQTDIQVRLVKGVFNRQQALNILEEYELKSLRSSVSLFAEQGEVGLSGLFSE